MSLETGAGGLVEVPFYWGLIDGLVKTAASARDFLREIKRTALTMQETFISQNGDPNLVCFPIPGRMFPIAIQTNPSFLVDMPVTIMLVESRPLFSHF